MNINKMFSTPEREEILSEALYAEEISVSELARNLCLSKGLASQYLRFLVKESILRRKGRKFSVDRENPKVKALKVLLNVKQLSEIFVYLKDVKGSIGLYGSWANGTNTKESDVDIWVKGELSEEKIAELKGKISRKMGKIIEILLLDENRLKRMKKDDPMFYHSLVFGSITLKGESLA